jgi:zinc/manganese transport system ATP-binding protein
MKQPIVQLDGAGLTLGRTLWNDLTLSVAPGEVLAVLGPNGSGKTSLLRVLLGLSPLSHGTVTVCGNQPHRGSQCIGYVPQQHSFDADLPIRGRDLVRLGLDGHRFGLGAQADADRLVDKVISEVGATRYADSPLGQLSGGEQQRLRIAQALLTDPELLLCDEPLLSLDLSHQQEVAGLIDKRRREHDTAVILVTHEINPILPIVDRVLYLAGGRWAIGTPEDVFTTKTLSDLYGTRVEVLTVHGRIVVVGTGDAQEMAHHG